jgi:hypothetical protein
MEYERNLEPMIIKIKKKGLKMDGALLLHMKLE